MNSSQTEQIKRPNSRAPDSASEVGHRIAGAHCPGLPCSHCGMKTQRDPRSFLIHHCTLGSNALVLTDRGYRQLVFSLVHLFCMEPVNRACQLVFPPEGFVQRTAAAQVQEKNLSNHFTCGCRHPQVDIRRAEAPGQRTTRGRTAPGRQPVMVCCP